MIKKILILVVILLSLNAGAFAYDYEIQVDDLLIPVSSISQDARPIVETILGMIKTEQSTMEVWEPYREQFITNMIEASGIGIQKYPNECAFYIIRGYFYIKRADSTYESSDKLADLSNAINDLSKAMHINSQYTPSMYYLRACCYYKEKKDALAIDDLFKCNDLLKDIDSSASELMLYAVSYNEYLKIKIDYVKKSFNNNDEVVGDPNDAYKVCSDLIKNDNEAAAKLEEKIDALCNQNHKAYILRDNINDTRREIERLDNEGYMHKLEEAVTMQKLRSLK